VHGTLRSPLPFGLGTDASFSFSVLLLLAGILGVYFHNAERLGIARTEELIVNDGRFGLNGNLPKVEAGEEGSPVIFGCKLCQGAGE